MASGFGGRSVEVAAVRFGDPARVALRDLAEPLVVGHDRIPARHGRVVVAALVGTHVVESIEQLFARA
jgi:hypothetical protein